MGATPPALINVAEVPPVPGLTLYFKIDLNIIPAKSKAIPETKTGVFFPKNFMLGSELRLLVFLHGHFSDGLQPVDRYWTTYHGGKYKLRHALNESNENYVLIAPSLSEISEAGNLTASGGLEKYLELVLEGIKTHAAAKVPSIPALTSIFLAAHSGGGRPMLEIAENMGTSNFDKTIKAFWGLDCLYDFDTPYDFFGADPPVKPYRPGHTDPRANPNPTELRWAKWANAQPGPKLVMHHETSEPTLRCQNLKHLAAGDKFKSPAANGDDWSKILSAAGVTASSNVTVVQSQEGGHEEMVRPRFKKQLADEAAARTKAATP